MGPHASDKIRLIKRPIWGDPEWRLQRIQGTIELEHTFGLFLRAAAGRSGLSVRKHTATADRVLQSVNPNVIHRGQVLRIPQ
jgi:hypothetical protein